MENISLFSIACRGNTSSTADLIYTQNSCSTGHFSFDFYLEDRWMPNFWNYWTTVENSETLIFFYLNSIESWEKEVFPPSHQAKSEQSYNHTRSSGLDFPGRGWRGLEVPLPSSPHPAHSQTKPKCKIQTVLLKVLGYERQCFNGEIFCWKVKQPVVCGRSPSPNITT